LINYNLEKFNRVVSHTVITGCQDLLSIVDEICKLKYRNGTLFLIGNGGSNAIISHVAVDIINAYGVKVNPLTDSSLITCIANDFEYKNVFSRVLQKTMTKEDILLAVSSSGQSKNIVNAVLATKTLGAKVITFTGFSKENPVRELGDYNVWLDSDNYMIVETGHSFLLHLLVQ